MLVTTTRAMIIDWLETIKKMYPTGSYMFEEIHTAAEALETVLMKDGVSLNFEYLYYYP